MRLLVNRRLLVNHHTQYRLKAFLLCKTIGEISNYCRNSTVLSPFFHIKKQRPKMDHEISYQFSAGTKTSLELKICFSLITYGIKNLIPLRSTIQITGTSAL